MDVGCDAMQSYLDENGYAGQSIDETMLAKMLQAMNWDMHLQ